MNIPNTLFEELKLYLQQRANGGDLEAQALLAQLERVAVALPATAQPTMDVSLPSDMELGC
ncbi:MAG TPA: hypothetical protein V6C95_19300 [Coleofasciculaceae cyanobacterium]